MNLTKSVLSGLLIAAFAFFPGAEAAGSEAKLNTIIEQQEKIITELAALKEEIRIVKIRVSSGG